MGLSARMFVQKVEQYGASGLSGLANEQIILKAVYTDDPDDPNFSYSQATPSAELTMMITNPEAFGYLEPGAVYNVEISKARVQPAKAVHPPARLHMHP